MLTEVTFAGDGKESLIAYTNAKGQNVFLKTRSADFSPKIIDKLITHPTYGIEDVITKGYKYTIECKKQMHVGVKHKHIWKPLIRGNITAELQIVRCEVYRAKRDLAILIQKLQEVLLYIEPSEAGLQTYSHKLRELLILACTDLECSLKHYKLGENKNMSDYCKILTLIDLSNYSVILNGYSMFYKTSPFEGWQTEKLTWYQAYNDTKHNRNNAFNRATLDNCLKAVCANIVMFCVRYSPYFLYNENDWCSNLIRNTFDVIIEPDKDIYIPLYEGIIGSGMEYAFQGYMVRDVFDISEQVPFVEE